jgi:hypothetical protein
MRPLKDVTKITLHNYKAIYIKDINPYFPWAVSPDSIIASELSRTAIAISETSALVGVGWFIILSNIFVATITGFSILRHVLTISAWKGKQVGIYMMLLLGLIHTRFITKYSNRWQNLVFLKLYVHCNLTCSKGTSSIGSSAPRSPRATIAYKDIKKFST